MTGLFGWLMAFSVTAALVTGVSAVGVAAIDDARAATAADAAALAGAASGSQQAIEVARRNGATLVSISTNGAITSVEVRVGRALGTAHAKRLLVFDS